jgi:hypothetical protein
MADTSGAARVEQLRQVHVRSGLERVLVPKRTARMAGGYTKMLFENNDFRVRSLEIHETQKGPYCRIHWLPNISHALKERLMTLPDTVVRSSNVKAGVSLDGDLLVVAKGLAKALGRAA